MSYRRDLFVDSMEFEWGEDYPETHEEDDV